MDLRKRWVHFRILDIYLPDPQEILLGLYGDNLLQGEVVDLTESGERDGPYAVVKVEGIEQPVIVPMDRILGVL